MNIPKFKLPALVSHDPLLFASEYSNHSPVPSNCKKHAINMTQK